MGSLTITESGIEGLVILEPKVFYDERGYFMETYHQEDLLAYGHSMVFVQDNLSVSAKGVLRGMHFQVEHPQGKLVRVQNGCIYDAAVDLRKVSKTYGKWFGIYLSGENKKQLYIPEGFAHGFLVMSDTVEFCYKCTDFYYPEDQGGLPYDDPDIGIAWPSAGVEPLVLERDRNWKPWRENRVVF